MTSPFVRRRHKCVKASIIQRFHETRVLRQLEACAFLSFFFERCWRSKFRSRVVKAHLHALSLSDHIGLTFRRWNSTLTLILVRAELREDYLTVVTRAMANAVRSSADIILRFVTYPCFADGNSSPIQSAIQAVTVYIRAQFVRLDP